MNYNLSRKNEAGKWWSYGSIRKNKWGNNQASFKVVELKNLIELAEKEGKEWVNLSLFENKGDGGKPTAPASNTAPKDDFNIDDEIPF